MSIVALGLAALLCAPGDPPPALSVATGVVDGGRIRLAALGLGDGGMQPVPGAAAAAAADGHRTPGGALLRVRQAVGLRIDLPSGAGVVVDDRGRLHLRDGSVTLPVRSGVRLWLTDGSCVELIPDPVAGQPPQRVAVFDAVDRPAVVLWRTRRGARLGPRDLRLARDLVVLGDGSAVFRAVTLGPVLVLDRELCPRALEAETPRCAVVVLGDLLAASLLRLPAHAKLEAASDPMLVQRATALAQVATRILPHDRCFARPTIDGAEPLVAVGAGFRLRLTDVAGRAPMLDLLAPDRDTPVLQWSVGHETILHLVDQTADGRARYAMQGLRLGALTDRLLPFEQGPVDQRRAYAAFAALRDARVPVRRR
ncbi:MAG: hypothetical protein IPM29_09945 [Planctomycetes bacterium]|nr:hypothetical protein [Planctomycetota bacterium]